MKWMVVVLALVAGCKRSSGMRSDEIAVELREVEGLCFAIASTYGTGLSMVQIPCAAERAESAAAAISAATVRAPIDAGPPTQPKLPPSRFNENVGPLRKFNEAERQRAVELEHAP